MSGQMQDFPETVEEFMEQYKMVDRKEVYSNGTEYVPIFRMKQWFEHEKAKRKGEWIEYPDCLKHDGAYSDDHIVCSKCHHVFSILDNCTEEFDFCPHCGAEMKK